MNNFFYNSSEYSLFKKALRDTTGEPVFINLLSTDPSLNEDKQEPVQTQRKSQSSKFEPTTPFGKFFGARKATRTTPVDMKDFSAWKNKNYRKVEQSINEEAKVETPKFSLSDYMNKTMGGAKFNDSDQLKSDTQKPINELSSEDPLYKRFSLDSYLHKLEEQNKSKNKFKANDDLLEPLGNVSQDVVPDSSQDEDFGLTSDVNVEGVAFDEGISGEKFSFEQSELDKVKSRLEKMEREAANIKEKATTKVINSNELSDIAHEGEEPGLDLNKLLGEETKINEDDIDLVNKKLEGEGFVQTEEHPIEQDTQNEPPKVKNKTFVEINRTPGYEETETMETTNETSTFTETDVGEESNVVEPGVTDSEDDVDDDEFNKLMQEIDAELDQEDEDMSGVETDAESSTETIDDADEDDVVDTDESDDVSGETFDEVDETEDVDDEDISALEKDTEITDGTSRVKVGKPNYVTKEDLDSLSEELLGKFTDMYKKGGTPTPYYRDVNVNYIGENPVDAVEQIVDTINPAETTKIVVTGAPGVDGKITETSGVVADGNEQQYDIYGNPVDPNNHLQTRILEMIEENKKADAEARAKLKLAEEEKNKMVEEYESRLKDLEQAFKKKDEESKQKAYLDKLKSDIKLKKAESNFKLREQRIKEFEKESSEKQKIGVILRKELKNNLNISNLEMDKKLLEVASKIRKEYEIEQEEELRKVREKAAQIEAQKAQEMEEVEEEEEEKLKTTKKSTTSKTTKKKTTRRSHSHTRTARRKIDSDIIGGINFE